MSNFDEALERFHLGDLEYAGGLASHGPMGAEALESIGHQALIPAFLDLYVPRLPPAPSGRVLQSEECASARGDAARRADWVATFEARLDGTAWRDVVREVVPGLLPGLFAAAGHGLLRTAHGVRSLEREESPLRRRELARGLAHWAARYQALPGTPGAREDEVDRGPSLSGFFQGLPLLGEPESRTGLFFEEARRLDGFDPFARAIEAAPARRAGQRPERFLGELARVGAALYLAHPDSRIAYVHAVTLPVAMAGLVRLLDDEQGWRGAGYALQAVAAIHSLFGKRGPLTDAELGGDAEVEQTAESWDEIRYRAACSLQEHAIKMAEACWREDRSVPDRILRLAASDAALKLESLRSAGGC